MRESRRRNDWEKEMPAMLVAPLAAGAKRPALRIRSQRGVTSIEYALLGSLIAVAIVATVQALGLSVSDFYTFLAGEVGRVASGSVN